MEKTARFVVPGNAVVAFALATYLFAFPCFSFVKALNEPSFAGDGLPRVVRACAASSPSVRFCAKNAP